MNIKQATLVRTRISSQKLSITGIKLDAAQANTKISIPLIVFLWKGLSLNF